MKEKRKVSTDIKSFQKDDLKLFYNVFKTYKDKIISLEDFLFYTNDIFLNNYNLMKEAVESEKHKENFSSMLNFIPAEKLDMLKKEYDNILKSNTNSINNINFLISNKEDQMKIFLEHKLHCLGWLRETYFSDRGLVFKISPRINLPYHFKDEKTKQELSDYEAECKKELEKKGFIFCEDCSDYRMSELKVGEKNVEIFENILKNSLEGFRCVETKTRFGYIDTIRVYCSLDCNFKYDDVDTIENVEKDNTDTCDIVTPLQYEQIDSIINEYISFLGTGYFLMGTDIKREKDAEIMSNTDIIISSLTSYISSVSRIYQTLGKTNDIVKFYESHQYSDIRNIMKDIHIYEDRIKKSQQDINMNDLLNKELENIKAIFSLLFSCDISPFITKYAFGLDLHFSFDDLLIHIIESNLKDEKISESFRDKKQTEFLNNVDIVKPFGENNRADFRVSLGDKNLAFIKSFCAEFGFVVEKIESEEIKNNMIIKKFTISTKNLPYTMDCIHSYLKKNKDKMFVCNDKE